ncbi:MULTISPECIES: prolyl oligopeptidase family protein [unclassified Wenzhouxiangella]|uniref:prolyl oligopeptidase family serine peptidase n=1 Tax=unclassified Wenzhouxiangella TaxID=2613841 RepID=UPI000E32BAEB|nr:MULTISPECIES: prolyl oligopeptidase family serine peptidase [unclassified Wenzhouxiangella]RFF26422.1 S9 family peptidase [Wenzhouxiangella sp. 15181]RFP67305.1 S9 family peptidase [Wenzhouxiangella sp. 15190]
MKQLLAAILMAGIVAPVSTMAHDDPWLWLENVEGENALAWARGQNERSLDHIQAHELFEPIHERALEILTSDDRIAYPALRGGEVYNFWRDDEHVRGIWRKTSLDSYRGESPDWDVILDVDALAEREERNWVWAGADCRYPDYDRCIVGLSVGGADAAVRREFDLQTREFVEDGFRLDESKSSITWRDHDSVFLGPAFTDEQMTDSGYPRTVRLWQRGTDLAEAETIFEGEKGDVGVFSARIHDGDDHYDVITRAPSFFSYEYYLFEDGQVKRLNVPEDADLAGVIDGQLLVDLKSDWTLGGRTFKQGALVAGPVGSFLEASPSLELLIQPGERQSIDGVDTTENAVLVNLLDNVNGKLLSFAREDGGWRQRELDVPEMGTISIVATDDRSNRFFYDYTGFLTPSTLFEADALAGSQREVRSEPAWFDAEGMEVAQFEAESADGTMIPYFVVMPREYEADGANPALLSAYGGFEVSRTPSYSGVTGSAWLERGGVYVLANIRGGGEFGPKWHQAALKENRQRAYDDLIAVSEDLIDRNVTSPDHLGIQGGSNGGLLVGAVMVQRPDLYNGVVCQVPLLDMKRFHKLLAGASWMGEYGNPDDPEQWAYISRYSPYQNVSAEADYPKAFFTTSTRDDRVHPGHARKMVARMLDQGHDVLYYENIEGGHGGAANLKQRAFLSGLIYAYLHDRLASEDAGEDED